MMGALTGSAANPRTTPGSEVPRVERCVKDANCASDSNRGLANAVAVTGQFRGIR
jgi:hypothetical protein